MDDIAIRVEGLGKRFRLRHEGGKPRYRTLREDILGLPNLLLAGLRGRRDEREEFWALKDISFELKRGEVLGIIGRNGAGKSTLLKILSRIMDPTCGEATVNGRIGSLLEVGTGFHPELTGRENIFLSGALLGMRRDEVRRRFDEIVAFAGVEKFLDTACKHYSSGMYARLGFAVAAHLDAEILLVDEVLAVGDVEFQRKCLGKMGQISQSGRAVVLVSHDLGAIRRLAHRCIWINGGILSLNGVTAGVIGAYLGSLLCKENQCSRRVSFEQGQRSIWFSWVAVAGSGDGEGISMGDTVTLSFEVKADPAFATKPVCFTIDLRTEDGLPVGLIADMDSGFKLGQGVGRSIRIRVQFDQLKLYPRRYSIGLWAGTHDALETYDERKDCVLFNVLSGGKLAQRRLLPSQGVYFFQPEWIIDP